jgi:hypothetical protein
MATTANQALDTGAQINPSDPNSVNVAGNLSVASSAPLYQPMVGPNSGSFTIDPNTGKPDPVYSHLLNTEGYTAFNPGSALTDATTLKYNPIQNSADQQLNYTPMANRGDISARQAAAAQAPTPTFVPASTYDATQAKAAHGTVDPQSLVQNQFTDLTKGVTEGQVPDWARTAVTAANQRMNALGLGASTMAGGATAAAILNTALPMAEFNANIVATLNLQNLSNDQQTLLSNAAWDNAAKQFNATSIDQNQHFFSNLIAQVADQNANRATTVSQFNAGETNKVAEFNANLDSQRQEFNTQNQLLVDQSNVQWRRTINTANTMGENAANQANAMNALNISQTDMNNLWQQARDEASWSLTASENSQNRALSLVNSALNRQTSLDILNSQMQAQMFSQLGGLGVNILGGLFGNGGSGGTGIGQGISNLFGGSSGGGNSNMSSNNDLNSQSGPSTISGSGNYGGYAQGGSVNIPGSGGVGGYNSAPDKTYGGAG